MEWRERVARSYKDGLTTRTAGTRYNQTFTELCPECHGFQGADAFGRFCEHCGGFGTVIRRLPERCQK